MPATSLIHKLETAVLHRNPGLAQLLQPGLTAAQIQKELKRGGIQGAIEPIIELYSWRNGTLLQGTGAVFDAAFRGALVPPRTIAMTDSEKEFMRAIGVKRDSHPEQYHLMELKKAVNCAKGFNSQAMKGGALERYFPFLWETGRCSAYIALDLKFSHGSQVVKIEKEEKRDKYPVREAYDTFEGFLKDAIQCNEHNQPLACLRSETKPIVHAPTATSVAGSDANGEKPLTGENTLVLRTDFSDDAAWKSLCTNIQNPDDEFGASVDFVSHPKYDGLSVAQIHSLFSKDSPLSFAFIIDRIALSHPDRPILVINLHDKSGRTFRVIPSELGNVENNLSLGNMGFDEFANAVDKEGIFRGFQ